MNTIPEYAVDLLMAAKAVIHSPGTALTTATAARMRRLEDAVVLFEEAMPVAHGVIAIEVAKQ